MNAVILQLFQATDADNSYALRVSGETGFRTARGFGQDFQEIWMVEVQSESEPDLTNVNWEHLLDRVVEAHEMCDPVLSNFDWAHPELT